MERDRALGSINSPPWFDGEDYSQWKIMMRAFLYSQDENMWKIVETGWVHPTKPENSKATESSGAKMIPKPREEWSTEEVRDCNHDFKARNSLFTALSKKERVRISHCETAKKAWDLLQVTYEGNKRVRAQKLQRLVLEFENMTMGNDESVDDFHARLINVTSQCHSLGDPFEEHRIVKKFLRSLPPSFQSKQTAIEEAQDIDTYSLDELVGNLKTFEMRIKPEKKVKNIAFNSVKKEEDVEVSTEDLDYLTKQFKKFFKSRNSSGQGSKSVSESNSKQGQASDNSYGRNSKNSKYPQKKKFNEKPKCFECGGIGHLAIDCGNKRYNSRVGKALRSTWSDSESDTHSENEEENIALTSTLHNESSDESDDEEHSDKAMNEREKTEVEERLESSVKKWEVERSDFVSQIKVLEENLNAQATLAGSLASEKLSLELELKESQQKFSKFSIGSDKVSRMIGMGKSEGDKKGIGFSSGESSKSLKFVKSSGFLQPENVNDRRGREFSSSEHDRHSGLAKNYVLPQLGYHSLSRKFTPICHHCGTPGHIRPKCNYLRRNAQRVWTPRKSNQNLSLQTKLKEHLREIGRIAHLVSIPASCMPQMKQIWKRKESHHPTFSRTGD
ncbi:uncharacterized protein LOC133744386 [Rosa rugosa]|uniref:uncharacterized protein LOC133744386 n=1 Tax=Rosa rugosa TaxID=74645 RepID=UPI002B401BFB|nr:uncharacterized protein LOC133744386 [Rosa rugosa]